MVMFGNWKAAAAYVKSKTAVWWDMDTCPVPDGYDARRVRPSIELALKNLGYAGPVTICARGNLEKTPAHVLQGLSSTGIVVKNCVSDMVSGLIFGDLLDFKDDNPAPATIMLISDKVETELSLSLCHNQQARGGYNLVLAYTNTSSKMRLLHITAEWLWTTILAADSQETRRHVRSKSGESASFLCRSCYFTALSVSNFTRHLSTKEHKQKEINIIKDRMPDPMLQYGDEQSMAKIQPPPKTKRLRKAFRTTHVLLLTKRRPRRCGARRGACES